MTQIVQYLECKYLNCAINHFNFSSILWLWQSIAIYGGAITSYD